MKAPIKTGDPVRIQLEGKSVIATVLLASRNGRSLMLEFNDFIGGYVCMMPLLDSEGTGDFVELIGGRPVDVVAAPEV